MEENGMVGPIILPSLYRAPNNLVRPCRCFKMFKNRRGIFRGWLSGHVSLAQDNKMHPTHKTEKKSLDKDYYFTD